MIGDGIPEDAVEPGDRAFRLAQLGASFDCPEVRGLQNIFGSRSVSNPIAQELQEAAMLLGEAGRRIANGWCARAHGRGRAKRCGGPRFPTFIVTRVRHEFQSSMCNPYRGTVADRRRCLRSRRHPEHRSRLGWNRFRFWDS